MVGESPTFFSLGDDELAGEDGFCNMVTGLDDDDEESKQQDSGLTETDMRRKVPFKEPPAALQSSTPMPSSSEIVSDLRVYYVNDRMAERPAGLADGTMKLRDLQAVCDKWEVQTSGTKAELQDRLTQFFAGKAVLQKGYTVPAKAKSKAAAASSGSAPLGYGCAKGSAADRGRLVTEVMMGNEDSRFFRPSTDPRMEETPKRDPKMGLLVPAECEVGQPCSLHGALPFLWQAYMVLRRKEPDAELYFECSDPNCKAFISFKEGVEQLQSRRAQG
eukprot:s349_g12.t1